MAQRQPPRTDLWDDIDAKSIAQHGADIADPANRARWCRAYLFGGNTLRLWNEATELKMSLLTAASLAKNHNVALVGKYARESGIEGAVRSLVQDGQVTVQEIGTQAVASLEDRGSPLVWDFTCLDAFPATSLDRVILFGVASHIRNWEPCVRQIQRVLKDGGRVVIAEAPWGGKELLTAAHLDSHLEGLLGKLLAGANLAEVDLPVTGPTDLQEMFAPVLRWSRSTSWRGLYLFYGQKGGEGTVHFSFPSSTPAVHAFLMEKPRTTPWDILACEEQAAWGPDVCDSAVQRKWARVIKWGGGFRRMKDYASATSLLWQNLKAEPGCKALVVGEFLEALFLPELRKRTGGFVEISAFDINATHHVALDKIIEFGPKVELPYRHQWDYPYADGFPDNYFDLVWFPQGVHHAKSWGEIAPRFLRVLKPGGQIAMMENRTGNPEFFTGLAMSGLLSCIAEKIWWAWNLTFEELPDWPAAAIRQAFGDALSGVYSLEWKGWLVFWGYKA